MLKLVGQKSIFISWRLLGPLAKSWFNDPWCCTVAGGFYNPKLYYLSAEILLNEATMHTGFKTDAVYGYVR